MTGSAEIPPTLFIVATPIGHLGDLTPRAAATLAAVAAVAAEDRGRTLGLLNHLGVKKPLLSYREENRREAARDILARLSRGESVALVTDAGTPGISDPGHYLVERALAAGFAVTPIPGVSALATALSASGLPLDRFLFEGFLPSRGKARRERLAELLAAGFPLVLYESPHRVVATLADLADLAGDRRVVVGRELTKVHEEFLRGTAAGVGAELAARGEVRGEVTLVVEGAGKAEEKEPLAASDPAALDRALALVRESGVGAKRGAALLAELTGLDRREIYRRLVEKPAGEEEE
jgi:16S rRNA (cytidine1402-2'-O)-methyltransferase